MNQNQARVLAYILQILSIVFVFLIASSIVAIFVSWGTAFIAALFVVAAFTGAGLSRAGAWILYLLLVAIVGIFSKKAADWLMSGGNKEFGE